MTSLSQAAVKRIGPGYHELNSSDKDMGAVAAMFTNNITAIAKAGMLL